MRHIGNLPNTQDARLFRDYLFAKGIRSEIEEDADHTCMIWVAEEEQVGSATDLLEKFRRQPASAEFTQEASKAEAFRQKEARDLEAYRKRFFTRQQVFPGTQTFGAGLLTYGLIVALCARGTILQPG